MKSGSITMPLFGWLIENDLFVYRFLLFTMVFYLHHLEGHNQDIDSSILPIAASTQKKSKDAIKWINAVKLIDKGSRDGSKKENKSRDAVKFINEGSLDGSRKRLKKCTSEIEELKQFTFGPQQFIKDIVKKEISKLMMDFVEALKSDQGGVQQEGGSGGGGNCKLLGWIGKLTWYQSGRS
ncbi:hypothetical protein L484_000502 [Morus notabilis]|uniref:Uncharacterized protein n=1 Tax=Morus notabilis TaxID=981085 RepID=W9SEQ4_9ROSA|nr:hypothetical protein L484_000502 [Morus notabilis]